MRLRAWVRKTGISIRQLALRAGVSYPTVHSLVHEKHKNGAQPLTAHKISRVTGGVVSVLELMTRTGDAEKRKRRARPADRAAA